MSFVTIRVHLLHFHWKKKQWLHLQPEDFPLETIAASHFLSLSHTQRHIISLSHLPGKCKRTSRREEILHKFKKKKLLWDREDASHCTINNLVKLCVAKAGSAAAFSSLLTPSFAASHSLTPPRLLSLHPSFLSLSCSHPYSQREMSKREAKLSIFLRWDAECTISSIHNISCPRAELRASVTML